MKKVFYRPLFFRPTFLKGSNYGYLNISTHFNHN
jgi:hypothetical protein